MIDNFYLQHIRTQMANGSLVLFTGAGFSLEAVNMKGNLLPSAKDLTAALWSMCYPNDEFELDTQLQDIYETAQNQHQKQLRSLLEEKFSVDAERSPDWYKELLSMPWLRCYTLNIDDLIEKVCSKIDLPRKARELSAKKDLVSKLSDNFLDIIHLNGSLADIPSNVTFSRTHYAERIGLDR